ncbi:MAG: hypothetical protein CL877_08210 [Dehalococcoidales bacterium]|nr:hypothetical protein [Dehalococcoidales bacterium]|tara:strand:+ start:1635 stop:2723 length:1089 start_codon:yes stop_codon:yes gene_type:complete
MKPAHPSWWDPHSNQPFKLDRSQKSRFHAANLNEYLRTGISTATLLPVIAYRYATSTASKPPPLTEFVGLGISPDHGDHNAIGDLVDELGVIRLLLRVPSWHIDQLEYYLGFAQRFSNCEILVNILQCRQSVIDPESWLRAVDSIITAFSPLTHEFQIGNAINRSKWGCRHTGEYLDLLDGINDLRDRRPDLILAGSSVIDFEPLATFRTLVNGHHYHLDACSCALYVNRRGSPYATQYGLFDLARKIRLIHAMTLVSNRSATRLWITETNWPLLNTKPYTPNSGLPRSTVDETTQAQYLTDYYRIAYASGRVERVYWWQLVNPGYGLVDHRNDTMRKMPSFNAFANLLQTDVLSVIEGATP